jgi:cysteine desulfurase
MTQISYLDYNATAPVRPEVGEAMAAALAIGGNPSSVHRTGRAARHAIERARDSVARLVGAAPEEIVFVSGGTEANHLALLGTGRRRVLVSAIEHDSVRLAVPGAEPLPVLPSGLLDLAALQGALEAGPTPALVSVMLANNETGVIQPIAEIAAFIHARGGLLHCDAIQAAGKIPVDCAALGADLVSLSAHKLGGPSGVGALIIRGDLELAPLQRGGGQERGRRAGTENLAGIVGFGKAAELAGGTLAQAASLRALRDGAEARLLALAPEAVVFCRDVARLPNTLSIALPGVAAETQVMALDLAGVMVSAGAACSSGKVRPSHVLEAMGAPPELAGSAIRVSLGWATQPADIDHLVAAWGGLHERLRGRAPHPANAA